MAGALSRYPDPSHRGSARQSGFLREDVYFSDSADAVGLEGQSIQVAGHRVIDPGHDASCEELEDGVSTCLRSKRVTPHLRICKFYNAYHGWFDAGDGGKFIDDGADRYENVGISLQTWAFQANIVQEGAILSEFGG